MPSKGSALRREELETRLTQEIILKEVNRRIRIKKLLEIERIRVFGEVAENWPQVKFTFQPKEIANYFQGDFFILSKWREIDFYTVSSGELRRLLEKSLLIICRFLRDNGFSGELKDWNSIPEK